MSKTCGVKPGDESDGKHGKLALQPSCCIAVASASTSTMQNPDGTQISPRRPSIFYQKTVPDFSPESGPDFRTEKWTILVPNVGKTMSTSNDETSKGPNAGPNSGPENGTANSPKNTEIETSDSSIWKGWKRRPRPLDFWKNGLQVSPAAIKPLGKRSLRSHGRPRKYCWPNLP